ncbi:MAG: hypothetical protein DRR06_18340 [Gammaproteobacteria bacterium]|nr:MAG: hypothetical protein DRR06_18340 [Gammaproteobacteria bacterium]
MYYELDGVNDVLGGHIIIDNSGDVIIAYSNYVVNDSQLVKVNPSTGSIIWSYLTQEVRALQIDSSNNILYLNASDYGIRLKKLDSSGAVINGIWVDTTKFIDQNSDEDMFITVDTSDNIYIGSNDNLFKLNNSLAVLTYVTTNTTCIKVNSAGDVFLIEGNSINKLDSNFLFDTRMTFGGGVIDYRKVKLLGNNLYVDNFCFSPGDVIEGNYGPKTLTEYGNQTAPTTAGSIVDSAQNAQPPASTPATGSYLPVESTPSSISDGVIYY